MYKTAFVDEGVHVYLKYHFVIVIIIVIVAACIMLTCTVVRYFMFPLFFLITLKYTDYKTTVIM